MEKPSPKYHNTCDERGHDTGVGDSVSSKFGLEQRRDIRKSLLRPYPEEHRGSMRLEGWQGVRAVHPSFETRTYGALLRMRLKGAAFISGRRLRCCGFENVPRCGAE
jgi:hypothetical protein